MLYNLVSLIRWIAIYPLDRVIRLLHNWAWNIVDSVKTEVHRLH